MLKYTQLHTAGFTENNWVLCPLSLILLTGYVGFFFIYVYMIIITMYSIAGMMSSSNAYITYLLTGYEGIASLLSPRLTIDRGEAEINSQGRGNNKLAIPEYTVYKNFIIPKNIRLIVE